LRQMGGSTANIFNAFRYASPGWLPLLVFAGTGAAWGLQRPGLVRFLGIGALLGAAVLGQGVLVKRNLPKLPAALGLVTRTDYLDQRITSHRALREAETGLPAGKRILLVEERVYYCRAPFLAASDLQDVVDFGRFGTAEEFRHFLDAESIGAIVVDRTSNAKVWRFRDLERRLGAAWPISGVRPVTVPGDASLYRVE